MVKFTDIGAYFGGRALGRRKLIPWLSPGKTWEGLAFGLLTAGLVGMAFSPYIGHISWSCAGSSSASSSAASANLATCWKA